MQIYRKVFWVGVLLVALSLGCSRDLAPQTVDVTPGKSQWKVNREQRRRARQAFWFKRKSHRIERRTERKLARLKQRSLRAEQKLQEQHVKKQPPEVQRRMKETRKEAEQNNPKRTLRQRLRLWKFKK